jgi:L-seryl-tRNA(Ser) seleniumtransferase
MPMAVKKELVISRRRFLGCVPVAALGAVTQLPASPAGASAGEDYYAKLGVQPIINAAGTYIFLTAAVMPPSVRQDCAAY